MDVAQKNGRRSVSNVLALSSLCYVCSPLLFLAASASGHDHFVFLSLSFSLFLFSVCLTIILLVNFAQGSDYIIYWYLHCIWTYMYDHQMELGEQDSSILLQQK